MKCSVVPSVHLGIVRQSVTRWRAQLDTRDRHTGDRPFQDASAPAEDESMPSPACLIPQDWPSPSSSPETTAALSPLQSCTSTPLNSLPATRGPAPLQSERLGILQGLLAEDSREEPFHDVRLVLCRTPPTPQRSCPERRASDATARPQRRSRHGPRHLFDLLKCVVL